MRLTDANFEQEVLESDVPVFVDFWASWCPPCKQTEPIVDRLADAYSGKVKTGKLNVDQNPNTAAKYNIKGVPTFITFKEGKEVSRKVAAQPERQLRKMLDSLL